jgi:prephenate dehydrogenase
VGSTKLPICEGIANHPKRRNFIATHPIAGTEFSGPSAAIKGLFQGKQTLFVRRENDFKLQERALALFQEMECRLVYGSKIAR